MRQAMRLVVKQIGCSVGTVCQFYQITCATPGECFHFHLVAEGSTCPQGHDKTLQLAPPEFLQHPSAHVKQDLFSPARKRNQ